MGIVLIVLIWATTINISITWKVLLTIWVVLNMLSE